MRVPNQPQPPPAWPDQSRPGQNWPDQNWPDQNWPDQNWQDQDRSGHDDPPRGGRVGRGGKGGGKVRGSKAREGKGSKVGAQGDRRPLPWWTGRDVLVAQATRVLMIGCLAAGPVALFWPAAPAPVAGTATSYVSDGESRAVAAEAAARLVMVWLTTTTEHAADLASAYPDLTATAVNLPAQASTVDHLTVASVAGNDSAGWSVVVGADVTDPGAAPAAPAAPAVRRYFSVPVLVTLGGGTRTATVIALPSPAPAPASGTAPGLAYPQDVPLDSPISATVQSFLAAYLTGEGELSRYSSPSAQFGAVVPAVAASLRLTQVRATTVVDASATPEEGEPLSVYVNVDLVNGADQARTTGYALRLKARGGRWEVSALDPVPLLVTGTSGQPASPSPPPSGSPAATAPSTR